MMDELAGRETHALYSQQCRQIRAPRLMDGPVGKKIHLLYSHQCHQNRATKDGSASGEIILLAVIPPVPLKSRATDEGLAGKREKLTS